MSSNNKTARYAMRIQPHVLIRLREMAETLDVKLTDLLIVGAMSMYLKAKTPSGYLAEKSDFLVLMTETREDA